MKLKKIAIAAAIACTVGNLLYSPFTIYASDEYDADDAVEYAFLYGNSPNSTYKYYSDKGDCTNFVSQCIFKGGMKMDAASRTDLGFDAPNYNRILSRRNDWFYYNIEYGASVTTQAWTTVDGFNSYWGSSSRCSVIRSGITYNSLALYVKPGDVVSVGKKVNGVIDYTHNIICVCKDSYASTKVYFASHTYDYSKKSLQAIVDSNDSTLYFRITRFK